MPTRQKPAWDIVDLSSAGQSIALDLTGIAH